MLTKMERTPPATSERFATPEQAQAFVDEVERVLVNIPVHPGGSVGGQPYAAWQKHSYAGHTFIRYPDGEPDTSEPDASFLACVSKVLTGSGTSEVILARHSETSGLQLFRRVMFSPSTTTERHRVGNRILFSEQPRAFQPPRPLVQPLPHELPYVDAETLINTLRNIDPAPGR